MLVMLAMLSALAWIVASVVRIPIVPAVGFLGYEPKDVILVIAGFLYGPIAPLAMAALLSIIEMITTSVTGWLGAIQNFISSCVFCCTAALIYKRWRTLKGAAVGLSVGTLLTAGIMLPSNYIFAPVFMDMQLGIGQEAARSMVVSMLIPGFLPFNLIKYGLNTALTMILYKRIRSALNAARILPFVQEAPTIRSIKINIIILAISTLIIIICITFVLALYGWVFFYNPMD